MREIDGLGVFWLSGHEEDALSGRLEFGPKGGINLSLVGLFDNAPSNDRDAETRIFGWVGSNKVTLDRCFSYGQNLRSPGVAEVRYRANRMFVGHHLEQGEPSFQSASMEVGGLDDWVGRSGITEVSDFPIDESAQESIYKVRFTPLPDESHPFSRGRLKLTYAWEPGGDPIHGIRFRQRPVIRIEYDEVQGFDVIEKDVSRIQNLVTLCLDDPTILDALILSRPDIRAKMLSGDDAGHAQSIEFLAPQIRYIEPLDRKPRHSYEMLLNYEDLGGVLAITRWLDESERFQRALDSMMSIKHAEHMYAENRFLNVTFAAEAFHRITQDGAQMDDELFTELFNSYLESTPEEHHKWLRSKIGFGNEPPLRKRLQQLAARAGAAARPLIGDGGRWAHTLSQVRNELTHLGVDSRVFSGSDLVFLTESVYAVVRICMLMESGVSPTTLVEKSDSQAMTWYQARLKESIERVRVQLARN